MRRQALERQRKLNEERRRLDEAEADLAADFAVQQEECVVARDAMRAAELAMGRVVDRMIGELRIRYPRAAQLLEMPEDELRRLRQLATDPTSTATVTGTDGGDKKKTRKARAATRAHARSQHAASVTTTAEDRAAATVVGSDSAAPMAGDRDGSVTQVDGALNE